LNPLPTLAPTGCVGVATRFVGDGLGCRVALPPENKQSTRAPTQPVVGVRYVWVGQACCLVVATTTETHRR
jgi:hypothetical protein